MKYTIVKQILINNIPQATIWVAKDNDNDVIYSYDNEIDANDRLSELEVEDTTGRKFKIITTN